MTTDNTGTTKSKGFFSLFRGKKKDTSDCCCNVKIVPQEETAKEGCCDVKIVPNENDKAAACDCGCDSKECC